MSMLRQPIVLVLLGLGFISGWSPSARIEKKHPAEEKGIKSTSGDFETTIKFVNKSERAVKVYWIDYDGNRKLYGTVKDGESYEGKTYLTHPWLITDADDNAWYIYFPDAQPRTVEIVDPEKE